MQTLRARDNAGALNAMARQLDDMAGLSN